MLRRIADNLLSIIYPQACRVCGKIVEKFNDGHVCGACWDRTRLFAGDETLCAKCSEFLKPGGSRFEAFCHLCDGHHYDAARAVGRYERALASVILELKSEPFVPARLHRLIADAFERAPFIDTDLIVPIPLSRRRLVERGFNQAEVLAAGLGRSVGIEIDSRSLIRTKHTPMHRAAMDRKAREATVEKAFGVVSAQSFEARTVLLVDDVMTSGATASKCAEVLKKNGARKIYVLTVARAANFQF